MSNIPKSLKDELLNKNVVPFIGAGISMSVLNKNTGQPLFPSWKEFVKTLAKSLRDENKESDAVFVEASINIPKPKYLEGIEHAKNLLKRIWYNRLDKSFGHSINDVDKKSLKLPKLIWALSNNLVITTNIDRVLQWSSPNPFETKVLDAQSLEYSELVKDSMPDRPTIWHLHGHIDNKADAIFSLEQFNAFYKKRKNEAKLQTLLHSLTGRTILFIGFSLNDAYVKEQLDHIHHIYQGGADSYYILLHKDYEGNNDIPNFVEPIFVNDYENDLITIIEEMITIESDPDKFRRVMPGFWEYRCRIKDGETFDGKEIERGGVMDFKIIDQPTSMLGFDIKIKAKRKWSKEIDGEKKVLKIAVPWYSVGNIKLSNDKEYIFVYTFEDKKTKGVTTDTYVLEDDGSIKHGTFVHVAEHPKGRSHGIEGVIETRKMTGKDDLKWSPSGTA